MLLRRNKPPGLAVFTYCRDTLPHNRARGTGRNRGRNMNRNLRLRPASLVATAVAIALAQGAIAQEQPTALGEITVTARKRAESLQDVPFAISARTG